jgi:hypothetical protein
MSEPRRLLDGEASEFERTLLGAAREDGPSPGARARLAASLGVAAGVAGVAATAGTASAAVKTASAGAAAVAGGAVAGGAASGGAALGSALVLKWLAIGIAGGALAVGGAAAVGRGSSPSPAASTDASRAVVAHEAPRLVEARGASTGTPPSAVEAPENIPPSAVEAPAPSSSTAPAAPPSARAPVASAAAEPSPLAEETALLDRARAALAAHDGPGALAALAEHDRRFASGALGPEALVVRVEALVASGRRVEAERAGERFLASHPSSPHARRIRSLLGRQAEDAPAGGAVEPAPAP